MASLVKLINQQTDKPTGIRDVHRNPLLYSNPTEIEEIPKSAPPPAQESSGKSSFFFYFIILANSLLVFFVLGFIWFLFLKSPDLQIKEISSRLFGTAAPTEQVQQTIVAPEIKPEIIFSPSQQEKDETQQAKLKQMREKEELAAERVRLEEIKAEINKEKKRTKEAQQAINSLQQDSATISVSEDPAQQAVEIEQTQAEDLITKPSQASVNATDVNSTATTSRPASVKPAVVANDASEPSTNTTRSQVNLIMEALKNQQTKPVDSN